MTLTTAMSPIEKLSGDLRSQFSDAQVQTRKADDPNGFQFLNVWRNGIEIAVEWKPDEGFGLSSYCDDSHELAGLFDAPDEWYSHEEAVFHRIASLLLDRKSTRPEPATIKEMRNERGISQERMSQGLKVKQATYSKMERRDDVRVSSLRKVIEAMGGKLLIQAIFPDTRDVREITFQ